MSLCCVVHTGDIKHRYMYMKLFAFAWPYRYVVMSLVWTSLYRAKKLFVDSVVSRLKQYNNKKTFSWRCSNTTPNGHCAQLHYSFISSLPFISIWIQWRASYIKVSHNTFIHTHTHTHTLIYTHIHTIYIYIYMYIHTVHTYIHTYVHTYIHIYAVNKKGVSCRKQGVSWTKIALLFKCS